MIIAIKNLFAFHLNGALHTLTQAQYAYVYYTHPHTHKYFIFAEKGEKVPIVCCCDECCRLHTISLVFFSSCFVISFTPILAPSRPLLLYCHTSKKRNSIEQIFLSRIIGRGSYKYACLPIFCVNTQVIIQRNKWTHVQRTRTLNLRLFTANGFAIHFMCVVCFSVMEIWRSGN